MKAGESGNLQVRRKPKQEKCWKPGRPILREVSFDYPAREKSSLKNLHKNILSIQKLIYLTDQDGIKGSDGKVISELYDVELEDMIKTGIVKDGMLTKANTILNAVRRGISGVHIINGITPHSLLTELFTAHGIGTVCKKSFNKKMLSR